MFPLNTKQFSAAFLDVKRNSQGYNEEVSSVDRDATKKLLRPFHISQIGPSSIPQCHHLGTMMWNFMWNCARRECYPPAHHLESREDSRMESRRAPEQSCSSVLPEFELHRVTSKHKAREANERQSAENIELSRLVKTQSLNKTSSTRSTDSSRNNVCCVEAEPQNRGILQQSSCEEANVSNETFVNSKLSKSIRASHWDSDMKSSESEHCIVSDYFDRESKLSPTCNVLSELETKVDVNGIYGRESLHRDLVCNGDWWLNSDNISNLKDSTAPLIPHAYSIEEGDFVGKKKFLERLLETELQIKPLTPVKDGIYSQRPVSNTFTLNLNLETVMSVLCTDEEHSKNAEHSDIDLCGKISILYGIQDTIVSVVASEVVGMYDYISGAVYGLKGCCHDESEYQLKVIHSSN